MVVIDQNDIGKTHEEILMDLIYEATGNRVPMDKIRYGKPQEVDKRKDLLDDPNTFIPARINEQYDNRYNSAGSGFMYRRRNIFQHCTGCSFDEVKPAGLPFKVSEILDQINLFMPYPIEAKDIVDHEYTTLQQVLDGVFLEANPESLLWCKGHKFQVDTGFIEGEPLLTVLELNGFNEWLPS